jgi:hypothetical protein
VLLLTQQSKYEQQIVFKVKEVKVVPLLTTSRSKQERHGHMPHMHGCSQYSQQGPSMASAERGVQPAAVIAL